MKKFVVMGLSLALVGCQAAAQNEEPQSWYRFDCQPVGEIEYAQSREICLPRAVAAAEAGASNIPVGHGIAGAMMSGMQRASTRNEIGMNTALSCMAERGLTRRTEAQHAQMCWGSRGATLQRRMSMAQ